MPWYVCLGFSNSFPMSPGMVGQIFHVASVRRLQENRALPDPATSHLCYLIGLASRNGLGDSGFFTSWRIAPSFCKPRLALNQTISSKKWQTEVGTRLDHHHLFSGGVQTFSVVFNHDHLWEHDMMVQRGAAWCFRLHVKFPRPLDHAWS